MDVAKKRASLRGRGTEILIGTRQEELAETSAVAESSDSTSVDEPRKAPTETTRAADEHQVPADGGSGLTPEWADLLQEEALSASGKSSAEPVADATPDVSLSLPLLATTPARPAESSKEGADLDVQVEDESQAVPVIGGELQAAGAWAHRFSMLAYEPQAARKVNADSTGGAFVPAPKEKPEAIDTAMRAKLGRLLYQRTMVKPLDEDLEPDGPEAPDVLRALVGKERREALWEETLKLYQVVPEVLAGDANQADSLRLLQEAQTILLETPHQFDMARYKVGQVQASVTRRRNVNRWSKTYGWGIFLYEMVWIVVLLSGTLGASTVVSAIWSLVVVVVGGQGKPDALLGLWNTMMWGGMGGVIGAIYTLHWHVARLADFHKKYTMWYVAQPVVGLLLGLLVYLLIGPGFTTGLDMTGTGREVRNTLFPYVVACIGGFRQQSLLELVDRVVQVILGLTQRKSTPVKKTGAKEPLA
jgi:hypothetical protein